MLYVNACMYIFLCMFMTPPYKAVVVVVVVDNSNKLFDFQNHEVYFLSKVFR